MSKSRLGRLLTRAGGRFVIGTGLVAMVVGLLSVPSGASTSAGVTSKTIHIGMDIPLTGTGVPETSLGPAASWYWKWAASHGQKFDGRNVSMTVMDDQYSASTATQVCSEMAPNSLLMLGYEGSPNITACADLAAHDGIPYFSKGVDPQLDKLSTYYAMSPTNNVEAAIAAKWIEQHMGGKGTKAAVITYDTSEFGALVSSFQSAGKKDGLDVVSPELISLTAGPAEVSAAASAAQAAGAKAVYIDLANQEFTMFSDFKAEGFNPDIVMYGFGNAAAPALCQTFGSTESANVVGLNPWPELAYAQKKDPDFNKAALAYTGKPGTDSELALWATDEAIGKVLDGVKGSLTRQSLLKALSNAKITAPLMAPLHFTSSNHLGTTSEYMLGLSCSSPNQWTTVSIANA